MKNYTWFGVLLAALLTAPAITAQEPTLEDVLEKFYQAVGGEDAWKNLQTMKTTGKMTMGPMEAPLTIRAKRPDKIRVDFEVQGMTGTQAYDGETAWMLMPFMGKTDPEPLPTDQAKSLIEDADIDGPLIGYEEEGHTLELEGKEEIEGTPAYKIKVTKESGDVSYYFLDAEYYVPIRVEGKRTIQGKEVEYETTLSDYKEVDGLLLPYSISSRAKGMSGGQNVTVETIEIDVEIADAEFKMPEKTEKEDSR